jgi:hypothetical protein
MSDHDGAVRSRLRELLQRDIDEDVLDCLANNLLDQERIIGAVYGHAIVILPEPDGAMEASMRSGNLLICATSVRLLLVLREHEREQGWFGTHLTGKFVLMVRKIQLKDIASVNVGGTQSLNLRLYSTRGRIQVIYGPETNLEAFERSLQRALSFPARSRATPSHENRTKPRGPRTRGRLPAKGRVTPSIDLADQIRKLAELRSAGDLTQEEFDAAKRKLLGKSYSDRFVP